MKKSIHQGGKKWVQKTKRKKTKNNKKDRRASSF